MVRLTLAILTLAASLAGFIHPCKQAAWALIVFSFALAVSVVLHHYREGD